jgi:hypothetical protein
LLACLFVVVVVTAAAAAACSVFSFWEEHTSQVQILPTLNLDITSNFHTITMFIIGYLQTIFHTKFVGMLMVPHHIPHT